MDDDDINPDNLERGGLYFKCPVCMEKKKNGRTSYKNACCGQMICYECGESYRNECESKSLEFTCVYCRAEILTIEGNKVLLTKHG